MKYAPLKSDFVRGVVQDGTIKTELAEDMYEVQDAIVVDDVTVVDAETGEVLEGDGNV